MKDFINKIVSINLIKYIGLGYITTLLNVIISILTIKHLSPTLLGKLSLGRSVFQSFEFSHLGVRNGLDRHLPGKENHYIKSIMFTVAFFSSFLFSLLFIIIWAIYQKSDVLFYSSFYISGLFYSLISIYRIYYRSQNDKKAFINISVIVNIIPITAQIICFYFFKLEGLIIAQFLSYLFSYFICLKYFRINFIYKKKLIKPIFKRLFGSGYLIFISSLLSYFSTVGDRFLIADYWGLTEVGLFSVTLFIFNIFNIISVNYSEMILSKIIETRNFNYMMKQVVFITVLVSFFVITSFFLLPILVNLFLPEYNKLIKEMSLVIFAAIPFAGISILNYFLHAIDKRRILLLINLFCTILYFICLIIILNNKISIINLIFLKISFFIIVFIFTFIAVYFLSKKLDKLVK